MKGKETCRVKKMPRTGIKYIAEASWRYLAWSVGRDMMTGM